MGADTHFALTEFGMQIGQGFNDFTDDIIDGFSEFGDGFHFHINSARSSLRKQGQKFAEESKKHYNSF